MTNHNDELIFNEMAKMDEKIRNQKHNAELISKNLQECNRVNCEIEKKINDQKDFLDKWEKEIFQFNWLSCIACFILGFAASMIVFPR